MDRKTALRGGPSPFFISFIYKDRKLKFSMHTAHEEYNNVGVSEVMRSRIQFVWVNPTQTGLFGPW